MTGPGAVLSGSKSEDIKLVVEASAEEDPPFGAVRNAIFSVPCFVGGFGGSNASTSISPSILRF